MRNAFKGRAVPKMANHSGRGAGVREVIPNGETDNDAIRSFDNFSVCVFCPHAAGPTTERIGWTVLPAQVHSQNGGGGVLRCEDASGTADQIWGHRRNPDAGHVKP